MAFLSELIGRPVTDVDGKYIGKLQDLVARFRGEMTHPVIEAIVVRQSGAPLIIPYSSTAVLISRAIPLNCRLDQVEHYQAGEQDIFLAQDVLDKLIIDTEGARVVRVNDLELLRVNGSVLVSNVDASSMGIIRRIGLEGTARSLLGWLHVKLPKTYISWKSAI
jgi:sporulation protein YlmC with PRC-barrel domain